MSIRSRREDRDQGRNPRHEQSIHRSSRSKIVLALRCLCERRAGNPLALDRTRVMMLGEMDDGPEGIFPGRISAASLRLVRVSERL